MAVGWGRRRDSEEPGAVECVLPRAQIQAQPAHLSWLWPQTDGGESWMTFGENTWYAFGHPQCKGKKRARYRNGRGWLVKAIYKGMCTVSADFM